LIQKIILTCVSAGIGETGDGRIAGKKKPGNPHFHGPSGFSKPPNMVGRVGFEPTTNWLKANCSTN
jgi:hypothetical protein